MPEPGCSLPIGYRAAVMRARESKVRAATPLPIFREEAPSRKRPPPDSGEDREGGKAKAARCLAGSHRLAALMDRVRAREAMEQQEPQWGGTKRRRLRCKTRPAQGDMGAGEPKRARARATSWTQGPGFEE